MKPRKKFTLSLCMIAKNEAENLPILWASVKHVVDEWIVVDTGSTDKTVEVATKLGAKVFEKPDEFNTALTKDHAEFYKKHGIEVQEGEKIFEFGKAREFSFSKATQDFILWLDGDDLLISSAKMQEIMEANLDPQKQLGLHLLYKYELDQYQNPIIEHYRERVVPNNGTFHWRGRIHEIIVPTLETDYIRVLEKDCHVLHNSYGERKAKSGERNLKALLLDLYEQGKEPDPRTLFFLAEAFNLSGNVQKALELYERYIKLSGWDEEKCLAASRCSSICVKLGDNAKALDFAYRALRYRSDFPSSYSAIAQVHFMNESFDEAIRFSQMAINTEQPETLTMVDDKFNRFIPLFILAEANLRLLDAKKAFAFATEAMKYEPQNQTLSRIAYTAQRLLKESQIVNAIGKLSEFLKDEGELEKAKVVLDHVPCILDHEPRIQQIRKELHDEIEKRSQSWVSVEKRLKAGSKIDPQYLMFDGDLKRFGCKSILLVSNEPLLAQGLKNAGYDVKRVVNFEKVSKTYDAVFFDYNLHVIQDRIEFMREATKHATKLVGLCVPNRDPNAVAQATPDMVYDWLGQFGRTWNVMPLSHGIIYGCAVMNAPKKTKVTFFCGGEQTEDWGPMSHLDGGCGGSEEATIYLSRELAAIGYEVEVINSFPHPCIVEGVKWRHVSTLIPNERFENLILWRSPHFMDKYPIGGADKTFLWLHDVPQEYWFKPERLKQIDKIICLSQYHRSLLPQIPDEKFIVSQNGVDLRQFDHKIERNSKKVIYTSSYDRGLEHLLYIWPDVIKAVPDAELHIYYGWGTFNKLRTEDKQLEWKSWMMCQMRDLAGVHEHGRVDQIKIAHEMLSSGIFAYPCHFEEISCISAMKAQCAGCFPLTTDYAALAETNLMKYKVTGNPKHDGRVAERFKIELIDALRNPMTQEQRKIVAAEASEKFSWTNVAKDWAKNFNGGEKK